MTITPGFFLLAALLWAVDGSGLFPWAVLACALHEAGHYAAIRAVGGRVRRLRLTAVGVEMEPVSRRTLPYSREWITVMAGPGASFLAAFLMGRLSACFAWKWGYLFAGINLVLGVFQLLPLEPMDGGRGIRLFVSALWGPVWGERICTICSALSAAVLFTLVCVFRGAGIAGISLLGTTFWLLGGLWKNRRKKVRFFEKFLAFGFLL